MTTTKHLLPDELVREADGHLADAALACIADGEVDLVPPASLEHLDGCDRCSHRLGEAALLSIAAREALVAAPLVLSPARPAELALPVTMGGDPPYPPPQPVQEATPALVPATERPRARRPLPVAAIAAALAIALVTGFPSIVDAIQNAPATIRAAFGSVPFLVRVGAAFLRAAPWGLGRVALLIKLASALAMVALGLRVARMKSRSLAGTSEMNGGLG